MPANEALERARAQWDRFTRFSHRYLMPVAAAGGLTVGAALEIDYQAAVAADLPYLLLAGGILGLSTSFAYLLAHPAAGARRAASTARRAATPAPARPLVRPPLPVPAPRAPVGPTAPPPVAFATNRPWQADLTMAAPPGERIWHEWLPTDEGEFAVGLVGPVPETFYQPPNERGPRPFERKEPDFILETPEFGAFGPSLSGSTPDWSQGSIALPDPVEHPVEFEAYSHLPPHLRGGSGTKRVPMAVDGTAPLRGSPDPGCSSCSSPLDDARWHGCPSCEAPVCGDCASDSLWTHGEAWCAGCAVSSSDPRAGRAS